MKIAIDARYLGKSGIGRVLEGILDNFPFDENEVYLVGPSKVKDLYPKAHFIQNETDPFSKSGILKFNKEINELCDCILIPNFIIPYGIKIPVFSYIHDLIFLDMPKTTTKGFLDYNLKKHLFKRCVKKSKKIFCVSNFTIERCNYYFPKFHEKYILNYPGLSKEIIKYGNAHEICKNKENTIVFVGNVKPHKGIDILIDVFNKLNDNEYKLKIIGQKENFLVGSTFNEDDYKNVTFTGRLSDEELLNEISKAKYLVQPSLYEGFGIPPLEALYLGTTPIISSIDVFKEVYDGFPVVFFKDSNELSELLNKRITVGNCDRQLIMMKYNYKKVVDIIMNNLIGA